MRFDQRRHASDIDLPVGRAWLLVSSFAPESLLAAVDRVELRATLDLGSVLDRPKPRPACSPKCTPATHDLHCPAWAYDRGAAPPSSEDRS